LKPERWGSLLVQENNREEKACDKSIIMKIIIIIIKQLQPPQDRAKPTTTHIPKKLKNKKLRVSAKVNRHCRAAKHKKYKNTNPKI
jgi:hypothetical protein